MSSKSSWLGKVESIFNFLESTLPVIYREVVLYNEDTEQLLKLEDAQYVTQEELSLFTDVEVARGFRWFKWTMNEFLLPEDYSVTETIIINVLSEGEDSD